MSKTKSDISSDEYSELSEENFSEEEVEEVEEKVDTEGSKVQTAGADDDDDELDADDVEEDDQDDAEAEEDIKKEDEEEAGEGEEDVDIVESAEYDEDCVKDTKRKKMVDMSDVIELEEVGNMPTQEKRIPDEERIMFPPPRLTKYEITRIIGVRTTQIDSQAAIFITNYKGLTSKQIAIEELKNSVSGLLIKRKFPNSMFELWKLSELEIKIPLDILLSV